MSRVYFLLSFIKKLTGDILIFDNNKISARQLQVLIIINLIGPGVIFLPGIFFNDSVINLILLLVLFILVANLIFISIKPGESLFESLKNKFGNLIANLFIILLMIKIFLSTVLNLNLFSRIIKIYFLPNTPTFITSLLLILSSLYLVSKKYEVRARLFEILIWVLLLPIAIIFCVFFLEFSFGSFNSQANLISGIQVSKSFLNLFFLCELDFLLLIGKSIRYARDQKNSLIKKINQAILFSWGIILAIFIIITSKINFQIEFPVFKFMNSSELLTGFIQNQNFLISSFIIISFFSLISSGLFFTSILFCDIKKIYIHKIDEKKLELKKIHDQDKTKINSMIFCSVIIFLLSILHINLEFFKIALPILGSVFYFLLPILFLIINNAKS